jgi:hypothetical protein
VGACSGVAQTNENIPEKHKMNLFDMSLLLAQNRSGRGEYDSLFVTPEWL